MKIGIAIDNEGGLSSAVSRHFGQSRYFCVVEVENGTIRTSAVFPNTSPHDTGEGGNCQVVAQILRHRVNAVITGGMGRGAKAKFEKAGVAVYAHEGGVRNGIDRLMAGTLSPVSSCREHPHEHHG